MFIEGRGLEEYIFLLDRDLPADIDSSTAAEGIRPMACPDSDLITLLQLSADSRLSDLVSGPVATNFDVLPSVAVARIRRKASDFLRTR